MTEKRKNKVQAALQSLCGAVSSDYTQAVTRKWEALRDENAAHKRLADLLAEPNRVIRQFVFDYLKLRSGESVHVEPKQWYVNYNRKENGGREVFRPHLAFTVYLSPGIKIQVDVSPHWSATQESAVEVFVETLNRVQVMVEAARK